VPPRSCAPANIARGANAGSMTWRANHVAHGHTALDEWPESRFEIQLLAGPLPLERPTT